MNRLVDATMFVIAIVATASYSTDFRTFVVLTILLAVIASIRVVMQVRAINEPSDRPWVRTLVCQRWGHDYRAVCDLCGKFSNDGISCARCEALASFSRRIYNCKRCGFRHVETAC